MHCQIVVVQEARYLLKMGTVRSSETSVTIYQSTLLNILEDFAL